MIGDFDEAADITLGHEAGYVNNPHDPGGETKFGISKRSYPNEDIANLTLERARAIYKRDFWDKVRGDELPFPVAYALFDGAINSGPAKSIMWVQQALEVADDGKLGPITLAAILKSNPAELAMRALFYRLQFMASLSTWPTFGRGWARRVASIGKGV